MDYRVLTALVAALAASAQAWAAPVLTQDEKLLLRQEDPAALRDHPDPKALKREWFVVTDEAEERADPKAVGKSPALSKAARTVAPKSRKSKPAPARFAGAAAYLAELIEQGGEARALREALALSEKHAQVAVRLGAQLWRDWVRRLLFDGDDRQAFSFLKVVLALDPRDAQAQEALGTLYWRRGQDLEALAHYRRALELDPGRGHLLGRIARMQSRGRGR